MVIEASLSLPCMATLPPPLEEGEGGKEAGREGREEREEREGREGRWSSSYCVWAASLSLLLLSLSLVTPRWISTQEALPPRSRNKYFLLKKYI